MHRDDALTLLRSVPSIQLAGVVDGAPMLRTLHHVIVDDFIAFHAGPKGHKLELIGQPVVLGAEQVVAILPSHFFHAERACPATTWFRSVQVRGVLEEATDRDFKARALQGLMEHLQPEGGHRPITADDPMYASVVEGLVIARLRMDELSGRDKRGQGKPARLVEAALRGLWQRGGPGDMDSIESIRQARPDVLPSFLRGPDATFHVTGTPQDAAEVGAALSGMYWNTGQSPEAMTRAHLGSSAWVFARSGGELVATGRACGDGAKGAWIYDVWVRDDRRGTGLGRALMELLMDHPNIRGVRRLHLSTKDADGFYLRLGFRWSDEVCSVPWKRLFLSLDRG